MKIVLNFNVPILYTFRKISRQRMLRSSRTRLKKMYFMTSENCLKAVEVTDIWLPIGTSFASVTRKIKLTLKKLKFENLTFISELECFRESGGRVLFASSQPEAKNIKYLLIWILIYFSSQNLIKPV